MPRLLFAVGYWYVYFVALPWWNGHRIEEETEVLDDGTSITKLVKVKNVEEVN
jgi:hypothetical protein